MGRTTMNLLLLLSGSSGKLFAGLSGCHPQGGTPMPARILLRELTPDERSELKRLAQARSTPARLVERARIILARANGETTAGIARTLNVSQPTVSAWVRRFN